MSGYLQQKSPKGSNKGVPTKQLAHEGRDECSLKGHQKLHATL